MIFVDSSAWIALLDQRDGFHRQARSFQAELARGVHGRLVTTDYILDESVTHLRLHAGVEAIHRFRTILEGSQSVQIVWTAANRFWSAWDLLANRDDKRWSLTDCLSFVTMESLGIRAVFGFDTDFVRAGFEMLPGHD